MNPGGENIWELLFPRGEHTGMSFINTKNSRYIDKILNRFQGCLLELGEVDS
jgi:transposase